MGLAVRIIPTLLFRDDQLIKGSQFQSWRSVGHVQQAAQIYAHRGVDELVLLDVDATFRGKGPNFSLIEKICAGNIFTPITVGGGVRSVEDVRGLLNAGADKVAIGAGLIDPDLLPTASAHFGKQAIVASIDYRGIIAYSCSGRETVRRPGRYVSATEFASEAADRGAGEILLTSISHEGMLNGYELTMLRLVARKLDIPVVAHGGCGSYEHMLEAVEAGASAVAAGSFFQFTHATPRGAAKYLHKHGIEVRL